MPTVPLSARPTAFAGWRILVLAIVTAALTGPGQTIGVSVFVDVFIDKLGLTRSQVSTAYLVGTLTAATAMPWVGRRIDVRGVRRSMTTIGVAFGLALLAMSQVRGVVTLALGFVLIRVLGQGSLSLVSTISVQLWFARRRGLVLGLYATGTSVLMSTVPILLAVLVSGVGWRWAWVVMGAVIWATVVPIGWFGMIDRPSDVGQRPDGDAPAPLPATTALAASSEAGASEGQADGSFTRSEALHSIRFWVLASATFSLSMLVTALNFHQVSLLGDAGLSATEAAVMFLPQTVGAALAGILFGTLVDRLSGRVMIPMAMGLLATALLLAGALSRGPLVVVYAVILGASGGSFRSVGGTLLPRWFGTAHIGAISGSMTLIGVGASALGPVVFSLARDSTGDYRTASLVFTAAPVLVALISLSLRSASMAEPRHDTQPPSHP